LPPRELRLGGRRIDHFCNADPIDPQSTQPTNLERAVERVNGMDASGLRGSLSMTVDDHDLRELTPALARWAPEVLINKLRTFARDFGRRSGNAARYLAFQLPKISALLTNTEVMELRAAYDRFVAKPETVADSEQEVGAQYFLLALLPHLDAANQLRALLALPPGQGESIELREHFKALEPETLAKRLEEAEASLSPLALRRTLFFASAGQTALNDLSRAILHRCFAHADYVVRLIAFYAAAKLRDEVLLAALAQSGWSALPAASKASRAFMAQERSRTRLRSIIPSIH
jgi:hypothetical protein